MVQKIFAMILILVGILGLLWWMVGRHANTSEERNRTVFIVSVLSLIVAFVLSFDPV